MDDNKNNKEINKNIIRSKRLTAIGFDLKFDLIISLSKEQYNNICIDFNKINNLEYIKNKINENLLSSIRIYSDNFLFNTILFINRASKLKSNIKYIIPFIYKIPERLSFIENIIKSILYKERIFLIPLNLKNKEAEINFIFNLIQNNQIISTKKFLIENFCEYNGNKELEINNIKNIMIKKDKKEKNMQDYIKFQIIKNALNKCDFLLTSTEIINNYIKIFNDKKYFEKIIKYLECMKLCVVYDIPLEHSFMEFMERIFSITDIYIFEKSELEKFLSKNNKNNRNVTKNCKNKNDDNNLVKRFIRGIEQIYYKNYKIEIVIDKLKKVNIIQHDSPSQIAVENFEEPIIYQDNLYLNNEEDDIIISKNYNHLKSVYIGAFLSRLFYKRTFNTCLEASLKCLKKVMNLFKNNRIENKPNYYTTFIKKLNHSKSVQNLKYAKLESQFILDGNNICEMNSKKEYNSIYDDNCISFFESLNNRVFLYKQGFINKKGRILVDPDRILKSKDLKGKSNVNLYQKIIRNFNKIKTRNQASQKILSKLSMAKDVKFNKNNSDIQTFNEINKNKAEKEYFLPSLKSEKSELIFGNKLYINEIKKIKINSNINKRYFKGFSFNKTIYKSAQKSDDFNKSRKRHIHLVKINLKKYKPYRANSYNGFPYTTILEKK